VRTGAEVTALVADTARACTIDDLPAGAVEAIKRSILDLLACSVAGSTSEGARIVAAWAGAAGTDGTVVVGTTGRLPPPMAALANGTSGHALDFDDVSMRMVHPSTTMVPGLLAVGEDRRLSGRQLLDGYLAGFEVQARLCSAVNPEHYERGWHTTGTIGPIGTAAAVSRAIGLDDDATRRALGIAASTSSSIRKNFGSMVKALHAGQAAYNGVLASGLAERGFSADRSVFDGANGFLDVFSRLELLEPLRAAFAPRAPYEIVTSGVALKRFASCGAIHTALDAILQLQASEKFGPNEVQRIECRVNRLVPEILVHHVTQRGLEGKFSMEYSAAVCLLDGRAGLEQYTDVRASDPALLALMQKVTVVVDASIPVNLAYFGSKVTVELDDGRIRSTSVDVPAGYPQHPLSDAELLAKVRDCCCSTLTDRRVEQLVDAVRHLDDVADVTEVARLLVRDRGPTRNGAAP